MPFEKYYNKPGKIAKGVIGMTTERTSGPMESRVFL